MRRSEPGDEPGDELGDELGDQAPSAPVRRVADARGRDARPARSTAVLVGAVVLAALIFAIVRAPRRPLDAKVSGAPPEPSYDPHAAERLAAAMSDLEKLPPMEGPSLAKLHEALEGLGGTNVGWKLPDGSPPPPLPPHTPGAVRLGIVLVRYRGAQLAPADAPDREAALARANAIAELAKTDFAAAVKQGDYGSTTDIGAVQRGILEAGTQYVVFTMAPGTIAPVLDTPRGFWIVRRIR